MPTTNECCIDGSDVRGLNSGKINATTLFQALTDARVSAVVANTSKRVVHAVLLKKAFFVCIVIRPLRCLRSCRPATERLTRGEVALTR